MAPRSTRQVFENIQSISQESYGDFAPDTLHRFAQIESSYGQDPGAYKMGSDFMGTFQIGSGEYTEFGPTTGSALDTTSSGIATLNYAKENIANKGTWKDYGMDKRLGELGISKGEAAYMTHQQGRSGFIQLITGLTGGEGDIKKYGGKFAAGGTIGDKRKHKLLENISAEQDASGKDIDFSAMDTKELASNWLRQTRAKWSKAGEHVEGYRKEFGEEVSSDFIGPLMPGQKRAEKKRGLEKPERPSISDDEVFDSIKTDEFDWGESSDIEEGVSDESFGEYFKREDESLAPKRMSAEEKKTKYDKQMSRFHEKRGLENMPELGLRREKMTIGENIGIPNTKGRELDDIMKVLSSPDDYKVAR